MTEGELLCDGFCGDDWYIWPLDIWDPALETQCEELPERMLFPGACSPVLRRSTAASSDGLRPICTYPETRCIRSRLSTESCPCWDVSLTVEDMPESLSFFLSFLKIGIFTFGGGYAMIPLVQREVIDKGWVKEDEFLELLTLAQSAPGPIALNTAVFVGYTFQELGLD